MGTKVVDYAGSYAYSGIKHALSVMTEGLRRELRDMGTKIRVTVSENIIFFTISLFLINISPSRI